MSYCEIKRFDNDVVSDAREFRNSWGGHAMVWTRCYDRYLKDPKKDFDCWGNAGEGDRRLWDLPKRIDLPDFVRAVLVSTFDHAIVHKEHFERFRHHLRQFVEFFGTQGGVCHLIGYVEFIEANMDAQAIGFHGTSVCSDPWLEHPAASEDDDDPDLVPYNLASGKKHFETYDGIAKWDAA